jgi:hypothetical protein
MSSENGHFFGKVDALAVGSAEMQRASLQREMRSAGSNSDGVTIPLHQCQSEIGGVIFHLGSNLPSAS